MILDLVKLYMEQAQKGNTDISNEIADEFAEKCKAILLKQFRDHEDKHKITIRMSAIGKPLCQLQMAHGGVKPEAPWNGYAHTMQMFIGDLIEASAIAIMKAAKVNVEETNKRVELSIGGINLAGTYDIKIDGRIYDIKSVSQYQFGFKFNTSSAFDKIKHNDPFGYVHQGYLYAEADGSKFGGWIAINKNSGEWTVVDTPPVDNAYRKEALDVVERNIRTIKEKLPFKRCFTADQEKFYGKRTGNKILGTVCSYCEFKKECWKKEGLTHTAQTRSKAEFPKKVYYVGEYK